MSSGNGSAMFRSFSIFNYRVWFIGALVSNVGAWMQSTALSWVVLTQLTHNDAGAMGITMALQFAPPLLLVTSSRDTQVRPYNAYHLFQRVKAAGGRAKLVEHDGLSHENVVMALSVPFRGMASVLDESVAFIDAALKSSTATK